MTTTLEELAATMAPRCLGCGAYIEQDDADTLSPTWYSHGTGCRSYYGAGNRVDYELWLAMVENDDAGDRNYFDTWAEAENMRGVPSWFPMPGHPFTPAQVADFLKVAAITHNKENQR